MEYNQNFSYKDCIERINAKIPLNQTLLPSVERKGSVLHECNQILQNYKLPVLYRYMPLSMNAIIGIMDENVYMVPAEVLNDVFEGAAYGLHSSFENDRREIERIQKNVYVKAFSYTKNNNLMWSHYGDSHKGICIGYDFSKAPVDVIRHLYLVQYSNTRFSNWQMSNVASHPFLYLRKSRDWKYEKEFRLIYEKNKLPNNNPYIALDCIKEIQFGLRTKPEEIRLISNIVSAKNKNIKLFKTTLKENSFSLKREIYIAE